MGTLLGGLAGDRLRVRFPGSYFLVSGAAMLAGFPFFLLTLSAPFPWIWVWVFVAVLLSLLQHRPDEHDPRQRQPALDPRRGFALNILIIHAFGDVISPVVIGVLADRWDMNRAFLVVGLMFIAAGILWLMGSRHLARDTRPGPDPTIEKAGVTRAARSEDPGTGYALVRSLSRFLLRLFYARVEVVGAENVPSSGPLIVAANHHNSIVDAMLLLAMIPRRVRVLANAPLFRHFLIGPFLRAVGALPVHRRQEAGSEAPRNEALFEATTAALVAGGAIAIFPEGRTQPEPSLQELRTGTARMLLAAEGAAPNLSVTLLPVGLVFDRPGTFRTGRALVWIGSPVRTATRDSAEGPAAARVLTDRLGAALRAQIVEADDRQTLRLLRLAEELWNDSDVAVADDRRAQPQPTAGLEGEAARAAWLQGAMRDLPVARADRARPHGRVSPRSRGL